MEWLYGQNAMLDGDTRVRIVMVAKRGFIYVMIAITGTTCKVHKSRLSPMPR